MSSKEDVEYFEDLEGVTEVTFRPHYLPYTYSRVRQILRDDYQLDMITNRGGYKANRYRDFCTYKLVYLDSREVYEESVTLHQLRYCLAKQGYPLRSKPPRTTYDKKGRRMGCIKFLEAIGMSDEDFTKSPNSPDNKGGK